MKVSFKMLALLLAIASMRGSESLAQSGWFQQVVEDESDIYAVAILDANTAVALDARGRLWRISSGVLSVPQSIGADVPILGLSFADSTIGTAVGAGGTILRTTDGGVTWTPESSGMTMDLIAVFMADANVTTTVGADGVILRTTDGGASWTLQDSGTTNSLFGVALFDANTGIAVGDGGTILSTTDGGDTWLPQFSGTTRHLQTISFTSPTTAIAVGDLGTILRTTDGGDNWELQQSGTTDNLYGLAMFDALRGMAVGCQTAVDGNCDSRWMGYPAGTVHLTSDGGLTWSDLGFGFVGENLYAVSVDRSQPSGAAFGVAVGQRGNIQVTRNGGSTWRELSDTGYVLNGVSMVDANTGWAVGGTYEGVPPRGVIVHTTNGGYPWRRQYSGTTNTLRAVSFVDANKGTAVGENGAIVHTTDGGATWVPQNSGTAMNLTDVFFLNADLGWVAAVYAILRTTDGGRSWSSHSTVSPVYKVHFADADNGGAVFASIFQRTTDGGRSWTPRYDLWTLQPMGNFRDIRFADPNTVIATAHWPDAIRVEGRARVLHSTDGGTSWGTRLFIRGGWNILHAIALVNRNTWFVAGTNGAQAVIFRTTDGGATWSQQSMGLGSFYGVSFGDAHTGTAVGGFNIARTETGGE